MRNSRLKDETIAHDLREAFNAFEWDFEGLVDAKGVIHPLPASNSNFTTAVFEMLALPIVEAVVTNKWKAKFLPAKDNRTYPDVTAIGGELGSRSNGTPTMLAIDVKTAKLNKSGTRAKFTLGSYHGYFASDEGKGAIMYPYRDYCGHWIVGFPYALEPYEVSKAGLVEKGFKIRVHEPIIQPKWRIAGTCSGTGTTFHIGSMTDVAQMRAGQSVFKSEEDFREFWLAYEKATPDERKALATRLCG